MTRLEIIGNIGADAEVRDYNGNKFVSFRVADTDRFVDTDGVVHERTQWFSCTMQGEQPALLPYLKKGQKVFVRGRANLKVYDSATAHAKVAGADIRVSELELCGASKQERDDSENWRKANEFIFSLGYKDWNQIPRYQEPVPETLSKPVPESTETKTSQNKKS